MCMDVFVKRLYDFMSIYIIFWSQNSHYRYLPISYRYLPISYRYFTDIFSEISAQARLLHSRNFSIFRRKIDDFTDFFFVFSSRCKPKTDFSAIYRPKKMIFCSLVIMYNANGMIMCIMVLLFFPMSTRTNKNLLT